MRGSILNKIIIICCALSLVSCKVHKQIITDKGVVVSPQVSPVEKKIAEPLVGAKTVNDQLRQNQINFNTFNGKAKARLDIDGDANDVTLNIHIQRDKKIWVSVQATVLITIEVARALITPDSILIMNRLQRVSMKKPFSYICQYAGNQVNFKTLQALLIGNALPETLNDNSMVTTDNGSTTLTGNLQDMMYRLLVANNRVTQTNLNNPMAALSLQLNNADYIQADNRTMPSQINIVSTAGSKKINANLHYVSAEFDKVLDYTFNIPDSYKPVD